jgi:hypothetical protein
MGYVPKPASRAAARMVLVITNVGATCQKCKRGTGPWVVVARTFAGGEHGRPSAILAGVCPKTSYKYAFQFLVSDLLTVAWQADLVIDEHSIPAFQAELAGYLRRRNSGLAIGKLGSVKFAESSKERLVQLADLVAGAVRRSVAGDSGPLREIEYKMINL